MRWCKLGWGNSLGNYGYYGYFIFTQYTQYIPKYKVYWSRPYINKNR